MDRSASPVPARSIQRMDRVGAFGALVALAALTLLPFVQFRANRIVSGSPESVASAGAWAWVVLGLAATALALSTVTPAKLRALRGGMLFVVGAFLVAAIPWALGFAAHTLQVGADPVARVSIGAGAWAAFLGAGVVWYAGARGVRTPVRLAGLIGGFALSALAVRFGGAAELSIAREYVAQSSRFWVFVGQHLTLAGTGLGVGILIGVPLGIAASRNRLVRDIAIGAVGIVQTVPSLALLGLLVAPLSAAGFRGIGATPAIIALSLYALLPIVRNTYVGLAGVDPAAIDAGRGMGMGRFQLLARVEAPLALPLVLEGVRASAVLVIGIAAVTAFVGAGGLGVLVFQGWGQQADDLTLLGAVPMVLLAVAVDISIRSFSAAVVSPGIRKAAP